jgi:lipoprotein NlpD
VKYLALIPLFFLAACSSPGGRAPIYDAKSNKNSTSGYVASGKTVKPGQTEYVVHRGDTLYSIAWRADMDVDELIRLNNLKKPYIILEKQVLKLRENTSKYVSGSQSNKKSSSTSCKSQDCQQKSEIPVVNQNSMTYSDSIIDKKVTKSEPEPVIKVSDWVWPSQGKLTKTFANSAQGMKGITITNTRGTAVLASASGQVVYAGDGLSGYGNLVIIKHNYDYLSAYAHNDKLLVKENQEVKMGQKIAVMGDSGADNVGLHFDIRYRGKSVDPLRYLPKK